MTSAILHKARLLLLTLGWLVLPGQPVYAGPSCTISTTPVQFGAYDVFSLLPNDDGVGQIQLQCNGNVKGVEIALSAGHSNSFQPRAMNHGADRLIYNLYVDTARTIVWGNGTGGSDTVTVEVKHDLTLPVFGRIPPRQDAAIGVYLDNVIAQVKF